MALVLVLITTAWNVQRVCSSIAYRAELVKYAPVPGPIYIGVSGAAAAILGGVIMWAAWTRRSSAPKLLLAGALGYTAWVWLDRLAFQQPLSSSWPFSLSVTALLLAYVTALALDPRNRYYFGKEAHEREEQDRPTARNPRQIPAGGRRGAHRGAAQEGAPHRPRKN
ncbi:MAG TPA: hypothetical protein VIU38_14495 [Anaerolineales bacterium]